MEWLRVAVKQDVRIAIALALSMIIISSLLYRRISNNKRPPLLLRDIARVECLSTDRFMHKIELPGKNFNASKKKLVLMIPGNPGIPGFYEPFLRELYELSGKDMDMIGMSHTGHSIPWINKNKIYDLETQIIDKLAFIQKRLRKDPSLRLVLIGHSIGCHIALRILDHHASHIDQILLIQPAVMHIADTPRGKKMMPFFNYYNFFSTLIYPIEILPGPIKRLFVSFFIQSNVKFQKICMNMINSIVLKNCLKMAYHEMNELKEIDYDLIFNYQNKIMFIYGEEDGWCPSKHVDILKNNFKNSKHLIVSLPHAFMLAKNGSNIMAKHAWTWLKQDIPNAD